MTKTLITLAAAATMAVAAIATPQTAEAYWRGRGGAVLGGVVAGAIIGGALAGPYRGYYGGPYYGGGYYGGSYYGDYYDGPNSRATCFNDGPYGWNSPRVCY